MKLSTALLEVLREAYRAKYKEGKEVSDSDAIRYWVTLGLADELRKAASSRTLELPLRNRDGVAIYGAIGEAQPEVFVYSIGTSPREQELQDVRDNAERNTDEEPLLAVQIRFPPRGPSGAFTYQLELNGAYVRARGLPDFRLRDQAEPSALMMSTLKGELVPRVVAKHLEYGLLHDLTISVTTRGRESSPRRIARLPHYGESA